jgi:hypothetical protein
MILVQNPSIAFQKYIFLVLGNNKNRQFIFFVKESFYNKNL